MQSLHCTSLHFTSLHFTSLHFTSLLFTSLHFTSLHFTSLHFTSLHFTAAAQLRLPLFLPSRLLSTGLSLVSACTSPLIRVLRVDSADRQPQWRDTGGTVEERPTFAQRTGGYGRRWNQIFSLSLKCSHSNN